AETPVENGSLRRVDAVNADQQNRAEEACARNGDKQGVRVQKHGCLFANLAVAPLAELLQRTTRQKVAKARLRLVPPFQPFIQPVCPWGYECSDSVYASGGTRGAAP